MRRVGGWKFRLMPSSFISKIIYKKERVGVVEKNGKTYVKYIKARRFNLSKNAKYSFLIVFILLILGAVIKLLMIELASRPQIDEASEGIGD